MQLLLARAKKRRRALSDSEPEDAQVSEKGAEEVPIEVEEVQAGPAQAVVPDVSDDSDGGISDRERDEYIDTFNYKSYYSLLRWYF